MVTELAQGGLFQGMHKGMTLTAGALVLAFVLFTGLGSETAGSVFGAARAWIESTFSGYYLITVMLLLAVCAFIVLSRYGSVRLGPDDSRPEFSNFAWFSMLFSAGIGIGILFFGVAEPVFYLDDTGAFGYPNNPHADMAGATAIGHERAIDALRVTVFHWGLHGWAIYVIVGMSLAYFAYRKGLPLALRSALYPFIGERIFGPLGHLFDILGVLGCVFGVATSLGLGVSQMAVGLERLVGIGAGLDTQLILIALISMVSILSAVTGVRRGIRVISELNIWISVLVVGVFLIGGPTLWLITAFGETLLDYAVNFIPMGLWFADEPATVEWQQGWTIFYWGWWLAWAPFVGLFIARISKGRTLREFVLGVLLVPTLIIFVWLIIFGGNAMYQELNAGGGAGSAGIIELVNAWKLPAALFATADGIVGTGTFGWLLSAMMVFLLMSWFVTSSDSGTLVLTTILSLGDEEPPRRFRVLWGVVIGLVAAVLLLAGGLTALQTALIAAALPLSGVILVMTAGVLLSLFRESLEARQLADAKLTSTRTGGSGDR
ncbi:choline/glycine/proline betaine transport protein [Halomonas ventosae]|uniref:Choline/glycine/proline betaine transport protein n=1 Tax=Halomonas ventosae TaxID=229007 RepID=A0A4R6ZJF9_9GAMM|nr:BCCT family transporter [Halomonas ventosae]TDR52109.1 choline/glycine/proline betaine transport protein [Halomonas ventosae]